MLVIYGITTCRQTQKALAWLRKNNIDFIFQDYKKIGITEDKLSEWDNKVGYDIFFNRKGSVYKQLDSKAKEGLKKKADILAMLHSNPLLIKRPAIEDGDFLYFGFDETSYENHFFHQP